MKIQEQNFGVEIELTGISREKAASVISEYYETYRNEYSGGSYKTWTAIDREGRVWKAMRDSSITAERSKLYPSTDLDELKCEIVTPILRYSDIEDLQNIVRALRKEGAKANESCGIHIHVDGANHTPQSLTRLLNFAIGRQDLFYEALEIKDRADKWCKKMPKSLLKAFKSNEDLTRSRMEALWYSRVNDDYNGGINHDHYNSTRYHGINYHAFFTKGTIEFRLFNSTTHAGKIKAYIQFCLAMSAWAINANDNLHFSSCGNYTQEKKAELMKRVLVRRLKMSGKEFKTARLHLTSAFKTEAAPERQAA